MGLEDGPGSALRVVTEAADRPASPLPAEHLVRMLLLLPLRGDNQPPCDLSCAFEV